MVQQPSLMSRLVRKRTESMDMVNEYTAAELDTPVDGLGPLVALVALREARMPDMDTLTAFFDAQWPWSGFQVNGTGTREDADAVEFGMARARRGYIVLNPEPIPWAELKGPCAAATYWPEATNSMSAHAAHLAVYVEAEDEGYAGARSSAIFTTQVSAGLANDPLALGMFWSAGKVAQDPLEFVRQAVVISDDTLPVRLWVDIRLGRLSDGTSNVFTTGLRAFGCREIEILGSRRDSDELLTQVYNVTHYLLRKGPVIKDGDTVGPSVDLRYHVRYAQSAYDQREVMRIDM